MHLVNINKNTSIRVACLPRLLKSFYISQQHVVPCVPFALNGPLGFSKLTTA